jgi:hypothetical protein
MPIILWRINWKHLQTGMKGKDAVIASLRKTIEDLRATTLAAPSSPSASSPSSWLQYMLPSLFLLLFELLFIVYTLLSFSSTIDYACLMLVL